MCCQSCHAMPTHFTAERCNGSATAGYHYNFMLGWYVEKSVIDVDKYDMVAWGRDGVSTDTHALFDDFARQEDCTKWQQLL